MGRQPTGSANIIMLCADAYTRMHSSRIRTACSSSRLWWGGLRQCMLGNPLCVCLETPRPRCGPGDPSLVCAWRHPPGFGPGDPPHRPGPSTSPPGCEPGDPPRPDPSTSPWVWAWRLRLRAVMKFNKIINVTQLNFMQFLVNFGKILRLASH